MTEKSYKELKDQCIGYKKITNMDTDKQRTEAVAKEYNLVSKLNHEIFNRFQCQSIHKINTCFK